MIKSRLFDEDGDLINSGDVFEQHVDPYHIFNDMKDDVAFLKRIEEAGDNPDLLKEEDLDLDLACEAFHTYGSTDYYFVVLEDNYGWSAIVKMDLEGVETLEDEVYAFVVWTGDYDDAMKHGLKVVGAR